MTMHDHKIRLGIFLIAVHFFILVSVAVFWVNGGFLFDEMITAVGLIAPLFAGYTTVIISYINAHMTEKPPSEPVTFEYRLVSFGTAALFGVLVEGAVMLWAFRKGFTEFSQFTKLVTVLEGLFGVYVGQFIYSLFPKVSEVRTRAAKK